ncbi:MAG TPA: class I SAM-dependent methyltransferase [Gemmatimonadaceae bacterium]|nr:class I SAM-dependent methyltransferase [Gemmatimonadaceae bacterium]
MSTHESPIDLVRDYYTAALRTHGPVPRGVDWNDAASQSLRFEQLLKVCDPSREFALLDYGCGYGALGLYLSQHRWPARYSGYDVAPEMIAAAREQLVDVAHEELTSDASRVSAADYVVASGIFNVRLGVSDDAWRAHIDSTLERLDALSTRGFAFNMLTSYSDPGRMRSDLYYANPSEIFAACKQRFSKKVALLHDYDLYEFTILVRK